ncbi:hypothetical protein MKK75_06550, partial [Methylobacterium sp. J-030]|uniref:hypothetical protein n=1 Tax=Methylobacterium sp. J-030 TaxID=2836627 RepID=UPI001FBB7DD0
GTPNALTCVLPNNVVFASLLRGIKLGGFVTATNATVGGSAGVTLALTGIGTPTGTVTAPLLRRNGTALQAGDLPVNQDFEIRWDGAAFRMTGSVASDGGGGPGSVSFVGLPVAGVVPAAIAGPSTTATLSIGPGTCSDSTGAPDQQTGGARAVASPNRHGAVVL